MESIFAFLKKIISNKKTLYIYMAVIVYIIFYKLYLEKYNENICENIMIITVMK